MVQEEGGGTKQEERGTGVGGGLGSGAEVQAADRAGLSEKRTKDGSSAGPPGRVPGLEMGLGHCGRR